MCVCKALEGVKHWCSDQCNMGIIFCRLACALNESLVINWAATPEALFLQTHWERVHDDVQNFMKTYSSVFGEGGCVHAVTIAPFLASVDYLCTHPPMHPCRYSGQGTLSFHSIPCPLANHDSRQTIQRPNWEVPRESKI